MVVSTTFAISLQPSTIAVAPSPLHQEFLASCLCSQHTISLQLLTIAAALSFGHSHKAQVLGLSSQRSAHNLLRATDHSDTITRAPLPGLTLQTPSAVTGGKMATPQLLLLHLMFFLQKVQQMLFCFGVCEAFGDVFGAGNKTPKQFCTFFNQSQHTICHPSMSPYSTPPLNATTAAAMFRTN